MISTNIIVYTILNSKSLILNNAIKLKKSDLLLKIKNLNI